MKINGKEIKGKNKKTVVFPRENSEPIVIVAESVSDFSKLDDYLHYPIPPVILKNGEKINNLDDDGYKQQVINYNTRRIAWVILESLKPSNIEWETVKLDNPSTWLQYEQELKDSGFSAIEINIIKNTVMEANSLDEEKLEAARQVFLLGQAVAEKNTSGQNTQAQTS